MTTTHQKLETALAKHSAGDVAAATQLYRAILAEEPEHPDALHMLGVIAQQMKNPELALKLMEAALSRKPDMAMAWHNRGLVLRALGRRDDALQSVQQAFGADPKLGDAWDMAGLLLREMGKFDESGTHHAHAVTLQPDNVRYRSNYAVLLLAKGDLVGAYKEVRESERLDKDSISFALGNVLRAAGYSERSIPHYQRVARLLADSSEARLNEAMAWLQIGEMERAWELWKTLPDDKECFRPIPRWQGEKVGHLLLHEDQGIGDAIQCTRYIQLIRDRADKITLQLNGFLKNLLKENFPDIDVLTLEDPVPIVDARAQLMNLPALLGTTVDTIPASVPYLHAEESWRMPWRERLQSIPQPRVGLVWAGNPNHRNNQNRSLSLAQVKPLINAAQPHFVSLQKWEKKDDEGMMTVGIFDADPYLHDFSATAGLIMELDLVITVDTAVAHLAGALGKPVWILIPFDPDWRWMLGREDSPWYPTARLFRQTAPRNWAACITHMASELKKFIEGDRSVLKPTLWVEPPLRQNPFAIELPD